MPSAQLSTRQLLVKIPNFPCLYRHCKTGIYYGIKKRSGKRKEHSLGTDDRRSAERLLKDWLTDLDQIDQSTQKTTLEALIDQFLAINQGKAAKTQATNQSIINQLKATWKFGLALRVVDVKPSHLNEWLALHEGRLKNTSYNRYVGFLKQLFEIAVSDRILSKSPVADINTQWKKPQRPIRRIPTQEQFEAIVADVRGQRFSADAHDTADFLEFLGLAGLGQSEAGSLTWDDVDWTDKRLRLRRSKTQVLFFVPIYPHLESLLKRLQAKAGKKVPASQHLFAIRDGKRALDAACRRLNLPHFSQRNLRQVLIRRLWQSGVDYKLISKWQGHSDGGKLILDTYTEVLGGQDEAYEQQQLGKIR